jgi:hypothetical protein
MENNFYKHESIYLFFQYLRIQNNSECKKKNVCDIIHYNIRNYFKYLIAKNNKLYIAKIIILDIT